jgi:subtilisin family serine protease
VRAAIRYCATRGRGGRGIPILWAAGNGSELVSTDGYASNPDVMAIAASTQRDTIAYYSDFGPEICICAPSSGRAGSGEGRVWTTDRTGSFGYNAGGAGAAGDAAGDYTSDFGGTSAAAPLVAGIVALILSANSALTPPDVRRLLEQTADKIGGGYDERGHSDVFGYGRVNAGRAVAAAITAAPSQQPPDEAPPSIHTAKAKCRTGPPPTFSITVPAGRYFAVEVTSDPTLFPPSGSAARSPTTFFATWQAQQLLTGTTLVLPDDAWARLQAADKLFYRLWTSRAANAWVEPACTTPDDQPDAAPFFYLAT